MVRYTGNEKAAVYDRRPIERELDVNCSLLV